MTIQLSVKPQYLPAIYDGMGYFSDQTSMITAGYNRYYGGNILIWDYVISAIAGRNRYQAIKPDALSGFENAL